MLHICSVLTSGSTLEFKIVLFWGIQRGAAFCFLDTSNIWLIKRQEMVSTHPPPLEVWQASCKA